MRKEKESLKPRRITKRFAKAFVCLTLSLCLLLGQTPLIPLISSQSPNKAYGAESWYSKNILENSSFEVGTGHGWGVSYPTDMPMKPLNEYLDTTTAYHGQNSVKIPIGKLSILRNQSKISPMKLKVSIFTARLSSLYHYNHV